MNVIKKLRKECGLSQEELAKSVHVTQTAVSQWETGRHYPDMRQAIELADFFGVTTDYLLGRNTPKNLETFVRAPTKIETFRKTPTKVEVFPRTTEIESAQKEKPITDKGNEFEPDIAELIKLYRAATPEMQAAALGMLEAAEKARVARDSSAKDK